MNIGKKSMEHHDPWTGRQEPRLQRSWLLGGSLFLVQRNAEFLAEHGFDALEIFFH